MDHKQPCNTSARIKLACEGARPFKSLAVAASSAPCCPLAVVLAHMGTRVAVAAGSLQDSPVQVEQDRRTPELLGRAEDMAGRAAGGSVMAYTGQVQQLGSRLPHSQTCAPACMTAQAQGVQLVETGIGAKPHLPLTAQQS